MKLSPAQLKLLREICAISNPYSHAHPTAKILVRDGLARWTGRFGNLLEPTEAGREALKPAPSQPYLGDSLG